MKKQDFKKIIALGLASSVVALSQTSVEASMISEENTIIARSSCGGPNGCGGAPQPQPQFKQQPRPTSTYQHTADNSCSGTGSCNGQSNQRGRIQQSYNQQPSYPAGYSQPQPSGSYNEDNSRQTSWERDQSRRKDLRDDALPQPADSNFRDSNLRETRIQRNSSQSSQRNSSQNQNFNQNQSQSQNNDDQTPDTSYRYQPTRR